MCNENALLMMCHGLFRYDALGASVRPCLVVFAVFQATTVLKQWFVSRYALGASNAYSTAVLCLLVVFCTMIFQASSGSGLDGSIEQRDALTSTSEPSNQTRSYYASSQRLDWLQSTFGSSGWKLQVCMCVCLRAGGFEEECFAALSV